VSLAGIAKMLAEMDSHIDAAKNAIGVEQSGKRSKDVAHMIELENGETLRLMHSRWQKLYDDIWDDKVLLARPTVHATAQSCVAGGMEMHSKIFSEDMLTNRRALTDAPGRRPGSTTCRRSLMCTTAASTTQSTRNHRSG
jgi:hypothetical protein